jgi:mono/diheme cytochrome c family protein
MRITLAFLALAVLASTPSHAADAKAGKDAYDKSCKSCHGADGTPNAGLAKMLKVDIKDLKSPEVQAMSDADLKNIVTAGKGKMHAIGAVSGSALDDVVAYVRTLKK